MNVQEIYTHLTYVSRRLDVIVATDPVGKYLISLGFIEPAAPGHLRVVLTDAGRRVLTRANDAALRSVWLDVLDVVLPPVSG